MIKTHMVSFCGACNKSVRLFEEIVDMCLRKYYCAECKKYIRQMDDIPEK